MSTPPLAFAVPESVGNVSAASPPPIKENVTVFVPGLPTAVIPTLSPTTFIFPNMAPTGPPVLAVRVSTTLSGVIVELSVIVLVPGLPSNENPKMPDTKLILAFTSPGTAPPVLPVMVSKPLIPEFSNLDQVADEPGPATSLSSETSAHRVFEL